jgi:hypothetical protein
LVHTYGSSMQSKNYKDVWILFFLILLIAKFS